MRIVGIVVGLVTFLGFGGAYMLATRPVQQPAVFRIAEIPKADTARIAVISSPDVNTIRPPPVTKPVTNTQPAQTTPLAARPKVKVAKKKKVKAALPKTKVAKPLIKPKST